jgi:hypothetical protein
MSYSGGKKRGFRERLLTAVAYSVVISCISLAMPVVSGPVEAAPRKSAETVEKATRALFEAIRADNLTDVRRQIALGADLEARDAQGRTPIGLAVALRNTTIAETLNRIRAVQRAARDTAPAERAPTVKVLRPGQVTDEAPEVRQTKTTVTEDGIVVYDDARKEQIARATKPEGAFPSTLVWPPPPDFVTTVDGRKVPTTGGMANPFSFDGPADSVQAAPVEPVRATPVGEPEAARPASSVPAESSKAETAPIEVAKETVAPAETAVAEIAAPVSEPVRAAPPVEDAASGKPGKPSFLESIGNIFGSAEKTEPPVAAAPREVTAAEPAPVTARTAEPAIRIEPEAAERVLADPVAPASPEPVQLSEAPSSDEPVSRPEQPSPSIGDRIASLFSGLTGGTAEPSAPAKVETASLAEPSDAVLPGLQELPKLEAAASEPVAASPDLPALTAEAEEAVTPVAEIPALEARASDPVAEPVRSLPDLNAAGAEPVAANTDIPPLRAAAAEPVAQAAELPRLDASSSVPKAPAAELPELVAPAAEPEPGVIASADGWPSEPQWPPAPEQKTVTAPEPVKTASASEPVAPSADLPRLEAEVGDADLAPLPGELPAAVSAKVPVAEVETAAADTGPGLFDRIAGLFSGLGGGAEPEKTADSPSEDRPVDAAREGREFAALSDQGSRSAALVTPPKPVEQGELLPGEKKVSSGAWPPAPTEPTEPPAPMPLPVKKELPVAEPPVQTASLEEGPAPTRTLPPPAWTTAPAMPAATFAFSQDIFLGHQLAEAEGAEGVECLRYVYRHRKDRIRACVVDVKWPRDLRPDFVSNSIIYTGQKAVVVYQDGVAAAMYAIFGTEGYERVASHIAREYGPSAEFRREKVQLMSGGRKMNEISVWRATDPASGLPMELEIRKYDDVRDLFGDPYHGMIEIRFTDSRRVFQFVQPLDLMTNR